MGQKILLQKQGASSYQDGESFLDRYYHSFSFNTLLNNGLMNKTVLINNEDKCPLVIKIFMKTDFDQNDKIIYNKGKEKLKNIQKKIIANTKIFDSINESKIELQNSNEISKDFDINEFKPSFNLSPIFCLEENEKAGMIIRQFYKYNLKERLYVRPFLTKIEKIWLCFQLLFAINELHLKNFTHGDIKLENILLTNNNVLYLSDYAPYKPAYLRSDDFNGYTFYFGSNEVDANKNCYLSPERLTDELDLEKKYKFEKYMDMFSIGVCLAEIFMEENLFNFSKLLSYKRGEYSIQKSLEKIKDKEIESFILKLLDTDYNSRLNSKEALNEFASKICPLSFRSYLIHLNCVISCTNYYKQDLLIGLIYKHFRQIWKFHFGEEVPQLKQKLNFEILNKLIIEPSFNNNIIFNLVKDINNSNEENDLINCFLRDYELCFDLNDLNKIKNDENKNEKYDKNSIIIIVNYLLQNFLNPKFSSSSLVAMEMLKFISLKMDDLTKIQLIVPYFVNNLNYNNNLVKITCLNYLFEILYSIDFKNLIIPSTDFNYFDSYVFPEIFKNFYTEENKILSEKNNRKNLILNIEFLNNIDKIIELTELFLGLTLKSKIKNFNLKNNNVNDNLDENENNDESSINQSEFTNDFNTNESNENKKEFKKDQRDLIFVSYDTFLEDFKNTLFKIISNKIKTNSDLDNLLVLLEKLPKIFKFYGKKRSKDFSMFLISNFNNNEWIIQSSIVKYLPEMLIHLGEEALNEYFILSCLILLAGNNLNEIKIYELIKCFRRLFKMKFLNKKEAFKHFIEIKHFLLHPNFWIRNELKNFLIEIINENRIEENFLYLFKDLKEYFYCPVIEFNENNMKFLIRNLSRVVYNLKLNNFNFNNETIFVEEPSFKLLENLINSHINNESNNNDTKFSYFESFSEDLERFNRNNFKNYTEAILKKIYLKLFLKKDFDFMSENQRFFGKLFWFSDNIKKINIPKNDDIFFNNNNNAIISSDYFKLFYVIKAMDIYIKLNCLNEFLSSIFDNNKVLKSEKNFSKNFFDWRPSGQNISTLYDHNKNAIEKILFLNKNKFLTVDNKTNTFLWEVQKINNEFLFDKIKVVSNDENETKEKIIYQNSISLLDSNVLIYACDNVLYQTKISEEKCEKIHLDKNNITTTLEKNNFVLFTSKNLNIYDPRIKKIAISYEIPIQFGQISCMIDNIKETDGIYLGTFGGYLINFDLRINEIKNSYCYYGNVPILGINTWNVNNVNNEIFDEKKNYLVINSANEDFEIGLWEIDNNANNLKFLLKVNSINGKDVKPLTIEFPEIINEEYKSDFNNNNFNYYYNINHFNMYQNLFNFNSKKIDFSVSNNFYSNSNERLNKLENIFSLKSTVTKVILPYYSKFYNANYLISMGNDRVIRFWDIFNKNKNYIINAPNNLNEIIYSYSIYDETKIIQSNEFYNLNTMQRDSPNFSEYFLYNGLSYHNNVQNEFDEGEEILKYCKRISDCSHKGVISDGLVMECFNENLLITTGWDGMVKVWK